VWGRYGCAYAGARHGTIRRAGRDAQPVTGKGLLTGVGADAGVGGLDAGLVGVGLVPVPVPVPVLVPVGVGLVLVPVGVGLMLVPVGVGLGPVGVGLGLTVVVGVEVGLTVVVGVEVGLTVVVGVEVGLTVVVGVEVGLTVVVGVGVGGVVVVQPGTVMVSSSRVTAPLRASTRPVMVSPVCTVIDVRARMLPWKVEPVSSVAELPTCQKTLQAWAPFVRTTELPESVVSVEEGAWKIQTAFGSPSAFKVSAPETSSDDEALYTPGTSGALRMPAEPMVLGMFAVGLRPAASLYAVVKSAWAVPATASATCMVPLITVPGGNPVTALPGLTPRFPLMMLGPVLVTVVPARTPKLPAVPRPTGAVAASAGCMAMNTAMAPAATGHAASQA
jgi:hypothetical protein